MEDQDLGFRGQDMGLRGKDLYDKWNNIPHYTQTEINGIGPYEPSLTHHVYFFHETFLDLGFEIQSASSQRLG